VIQLLDNRLAGVRAIIVDQVIVAISPSLSDFSRWIHEAAHQIMEIFLCLQCLSQIHRPAILEGGIFDCKIVVASHTLLIPA
jgi:hypothetical protein